MAHCRVALLVLMTALFVRSGVAQERPTEKAEERNPDVPEAERETSPPGGKTEEVLSEQKIQVLSEEAPPVEEPALPEEEEVEKEPPEPAPEPEAKAEPEPEPKAERELEPAPSEEEARLEEAPAVDPTGITVRWERGIRIERNDNRFRIKLGGRFMYDVAWIHGGKEISSSFKTGFSNELRRSFGELTGTYGERVAYKLQVDLEGDSARGEGRNRYFRQAYVGVTAPDALRGFWVGVMREPFTMEDNTSSLNSMFMERALPVTTFAPANNLGVMLNNETRDLNVAWRGGIFRYSGNGAGRDRVDLVGRVSAVPWARDKDSRLLHVAASFVHQFRDDFEARYRSRPETHLGDHFVDTGKLDVDGVDLVGLELAGLHGPLTFQSEVVRSYVNRSSGSNGRFWGTYAQLSYFLSGEQRPYRRSQGLFGRVGLKTRFDWKRRTGGAWEIAARYSYLDLEDDDIFGGRLNDVTLGLNWYAYPTVRVMANFVRAHIADDATSNLFEMRFQIDF